MRAAHRPRLRCRGLPVCCGVCTLHLSSCGSGCGVFPAGSGPPLPSIAGVDDLPESVSEDMLEDDDFLKKLHHALLEVHLEEGALVCPETGEASLAWEGAAATCGNAHVCSPRRPNTSRGAGPGTAALPAARAAAGMARRRGLGGAAGKEPWPAAGIMLCCTLVATGVCSGRADSPPTSALLQRAAAVGVTLDDAHI